MQLLLLGIHSDLIEAWQKHFDGLAGVRVLESSFQEVIGSFDCLVSPANSFGLMDGGMDFHITAFFGSALEARVQDEIWKRYRGHQPVGTCLIVPTGDARCPWLAHCPTMTVPMVIEGTSNAFAAFLAALTSAEAQGVQRLACPGLGTGAGFLPVETAARQMRYAYDLWRGSQPRITWSWTEEHLRRSGG